MTTNLPAPHSPAPVFDRGAVIRIVLGLAIPPAIVAAAIGSRRADLGPIRLPPVHLHAPDLGLIATAPIQIQLHLLAVLMALGVGVVLLVGVKGTTLHRTLGWMWVAAMMTGAVSSLFIRIVNHGALSYIHLISGWVIVALPMAVAAARRHNVRRHARFMTGLFVGGLIVAGLMAFTPGRLMWQVMFH